jgi:hypothetical protein
MSTSQQGGESFSVFVSRPYDKETDPDKYWNALLHKGLIPSAQVVEKKSSYRIQFYDAAHNRDVGAVTGKVGRAIDNSDIFLCVLTEYRPSVLWETGYAQKLELPSIYLLDRKLWGQPAPILIGVPDTLYYDGNESAFNLIPPLLSEYLIKACQAADLRRRRSSEKFLGPVYNVTCYHDRASLNFPQKLRDARQRIHILTTNIDYFVNPQSSSNNNEEQFHLEDFEKALDRNVQITILTMDPDSNLVVERSKQIDPQYKDDVYRYREELRQAILVFYRKFSRHIQEGGLVLKLYDSLPTQMIYVVDDTYFVPSMAGHTRSRNCIHVEFRETYPGVGETYRIHFDLVLRDAKSIEQYSWIRDIGKNVTHMHRQKK